MEYLSTEKALIIDLVALEIEEEELDEELFKEHFGGVGLTSYFFKKYESEDPIVIGTGLLTGTLFPGSALGIITGKSPRNGKICHCPFTQKTALELKYAGYDYVVIKGKANKPVYLWIHDGVADIKEASDVWGKDVWSTTDIWRENIGDEVLQTLVIGPAGESSGLLAQICVNYWSTGDRFGFGKIFGEKKFKGIAIRGMGLLEIANPQEFVDKCFDVLKTLKKKLPSLKDMGIEYVCERMGHKEVIDWLKPIVHRPSACYNTPLATNTFVFLDDDPSRKEESSISEPGVLLTDADALISLKQVGMNAADASFVLKECAKKGIDPCAIGILAEQQNISSKDDILSQIDSFASQNIESSEAPFSSWASKKLIDADNWLEIQAIAYTFGIHPIFILFNKDIITKELLLEITNIGTDLDLEEETLNNIIETIKNE